MTHRLNSPVDSYKWLLRHSFSLEMSLILKGHRKAGSLFPGYPGRWHLSRNNGVGAGKTMQKWPATTNGRQFLSPLSKPFDISVLNIIRKALLAKAKLLKEGYTDAEPAWWRRKIHQDC